MLRKSEEVFLLQVRSVMALTVACLVNMDVCTNYFLRRGTYRTGFLFYCH